MYLRQDGYLQYYKILGEGIPMLCLPPFPWDRLIYRAQEPLETCAQLIIPDYRGLGRSTATTDVVTIDLLAQAMLAILDATHTETAVVLGVSLGAQIALTLANKYPARVAGLILAAIPWAQSNAAGQRLCEKLTQHNLTALEDYVASLFSSTTRACNPRLVEKWQYCATHQSPMATQALLQAMLTAPPSAQCWSAISVPMLVLHGEEEGDRVMPMCVPAPAAAPQVTHVAIPDAGALPLVEQPDICHQHIRSYLKGLLNKEIVSCPSPSLS